MTSATELKNTTALQSFTTIRPTPLERQMGRLMRAPDHGDGGDAGAAGSDAGAGDAGNGSAATDAGDGDDGSSILGSAADAGAGDAGSEAAAGDKDGQADAADAGDKADPPETYELKVTAKDAEGKDVDVEIDSVLLEKATPVLKELGLSNEQANKVAALVPEITNRIFEQQANDFAATRAQWAKDVKADKEIGGANLKETEKLAARALDHFVGPAVTKNDKGEEVRNEFRQLLDDTGLGNHPVMVRAFREIGKALSEDGTIARSNAAVSTPKSREEVLYPADAPKAKADG